MGTHNFVGLFPRRLRREGVEIAIAFLPRSEAVALPPHFSTRVEGHLSLLRALSKEYSESVYEHIYGQILAAAEKRFRISFPQGLADIARALDIQLSRER